MTKFPLRGELNLPPGPTEAIQVAIPILERWWSKELLELGGGTALAARWQHRYSTDVDLFIAHSHYASVYRARGDDLDQAFAELEDRDVLSAPTINPGYLMFTTVHGAVSLFSTEKIVKRIRNRPFDHERQTQVALESSEEILAKKFVKRMWGNGVFVVRDAYDVVIASVYDRPALEIAKAVLRSLQLEAISEKFRELSRSQEMYEEILVNSAFPAIGRSVMHFAHEAMEGRFDGIEREIAQRRRQESLNPNRDDWEMDH